VNYSAYEQNVFIFGKIIGLNEKFFMPSGEKISKYESDKNVSQNRIFSPMCLLKAVYNKRKSNYRGPPIPLHNMLSRKNILPFHESRKIEKNPSRSRKNRSDHDSRKNKTKFTNYYRMSSL
jgi:hypothetical protein